MKYKNKIYKKFIIFYCYFIMKILHIDPKSENTKMFNEYVEQDKHIFVLFYLEGCGPCNATRPEWSKIENSLKDKYGKDDSVVIADVDQDLLKEIKYLTTQPKGFPTIRYISNKGKIAEDYEDSDDVKNKDRTIDSFVEWIDSKMKKTQTGGKRRRRTNKRTNKRINKRTNKRTNKITNKRKNKITNKRRRIIINIARHSHYY
jgi:thiol-disulfide isomerase/thioredoxin